MCSHVKVNNRPGDVLGQVQDAQRVTVEWKEKHAMIMKERNELLREREETKKHELQLHKPTPEKGPAVDGKNNTAMVAENAHLRDQVFSFLRPTLAHLPVSANACLRFIFDASYEQAKILCEIFGLRALGALIK